MLLGETMTDGPKHETLHRVWTQAEAEQWSHFSHVLVIDLPAGTVRHPILSRLIHEELGRPGVIDITDDDNVFLIHAAYGETWEEAERDTRAVREYVLDRLGLDASAVRQDEIRSKETPASDDEQLEATVYEFPD